MANRVKRGKSGDLLPMRGIVRMSQSLIWGGGGNCKVYRDTAKICVIRFDFSPMALETFTSRRKKIFTVFGGIPHSRVTFNSLEHLVPAQVSV